METANTVAQFFDAILIGAAVVGGIALIARRGNRKKARDE